MNEPLPRGAVLKTGRAGEQARYLRRRLDRRNLLTAAAAALLFHLLIFLSFYLIDLLGVRDLSDWSGPVLVKIGAPDAVESPKPDPGELPEQSEVPVPEDPEALLEPTTPTEPQPESAPSSPENASDSSAPSQPLDSGVGGTGEDIESPFAEPQQATQPQPARAKGNEDGNNYFIDFTGTDDDVGRTFALDYLTSYMPPPQVLEPSLFDSIDELPLDYRDFVLAYYKEDPNDGMYVSSFVHYANRPFVWTGLKLLGYDVNDASWKEFAKGEIVVEFTVAPSSAGAFLDDFKIVQGTENPDVNESIKFGLSQWNYYNTTDQPIRGKLTYDFGN